MFLTKEILEHYNACDTGLKWFERAFPEGAETVDVIQKLGGSLHISPKMEEILHWGYKMLPSSQNEKDLYREILNIDTSDMVWESKEVYNSNYVLNSRQVTDGYRIVHSTDVNNSCYVDDSHNVEDSEKVFTSSKIIHCKRVSKSQVVDNSIDILSSNNIKNSNHIFISENISNSIGIVNSKNLNYCYFSTGLTNCNHCLFCNNITDKEFYLFNKPIDKREFFIIVSVLENKLIAEEAWFIKYKKHNYDFIGIDVSYAVAQHQFYENFSKEFFDYLKTIPNYNDYLLYLITLHADVLL